MSNLQALHDFYLTTKPNPGKVQAASKLLVRLCKQLKLDSPEDITPELYKDLPHVVDQYYHKDMHKSIQDKSMIAEMIGRFGPRHGWERTLDTLLNDKDENLRQYSFQSLQYCAGENLEWVLPYIENYAASNDLLMSSVAARIVSNVYSEENAAIQKNLIEKWYNEGYIEFLGLLKKNVQKCVRRREPFTALESHKVYQKRLSELTGG